MTTAPTETDPAVHVTALVDELLAEYPPPSTEAPTFLGAQFDRGLGWVHFPEGLGGLGISPSHQTIVDQRVSDAGGPSAIMRNVIGYGMCAPTVLEWGSDDQKRRYLRPLLTGEHIWCQLFSEPGAGSDFAGLAASAVRDGDEWIVNGQKVWTSLAHVAKYGLLVVRTDPHAVKHAGLTAFVVDMELPGVDVRALHQITGDAEFNEVYFTDVRIPAAEMLGEPGEGWRVSLTTLMNERVSIGGGIPRQGSGAIAELLKVWAALTEDQRDASRRDEVMKLWSRAEVLRLTNIRARATRRAGTPGPEGSIGKVASASLNQDVFDYAMTLLGAEAMLYPGGYTMARPRLSMEYGTLPKAFLRSRANSIEGGTTEVMLNILGERVLGLPGDARVDRDVPWNEVPRN